MNDCIFFAFRSYAVEVCAGAECNGFESNSLYYLFQINIYLTEKGLREINQVLVAIFSYLRLLENVGPIESLFRELQNREETNFRFQEEQDPIDYVESLSGKLKEYPSDQVLCGDKLYYDYDPDGIRKIIKAINNFDNMNIMIMSKKPFNDNKFDMIEKWFGTEYTCIDYPTEWRELWKTAEPFSEFSMPQSNEFISTDFTIFYNKENESEMPEFPTKILDNDVCELWFKQDNKFLLPTAYYWFYLYSPLIKENPKK